MLPFPISADNAGDAYAAAVRRLEDAKFSAAAIETLAAALDGVYLTCKVRETAANLLPDCNIFYGKNDYNALKYLRCYRGSRCIFEVYLADKGARHVSAARMRQTRDYYAADAEKYAAALPAFYDALQQYNVLLGHLHTLRKQIAPVMYCLPHCSI